MTEDEAGRGLQTWEQIQALKFTHSSSSLHSHEAQSNVWPLVVIRNSRLLDYSIFPPANHENLYLRERQNLKSLPSFSSDTSSSLSSLLSSASFSPSDDEISEPPSPMASDSPVRNVRQVSGWMDFDSPVRKFVSLASKFGSKAAIINSFRSFAPAAGVSLLVIFWLLFRRTRMRPRERVDQLRFRVKKKDEKISHLLDQIAQLNELLLAHKRLPTSK